MAKPLNERISALEVKAENKDIHAKLDAITEILKDNKESIRNKLGQKVFYTFLAILVGVLGYLTKTVYAMQNDIALIKGSMGIALNEK